MHASSSIIVVWWLRPLWSWFLHKCSASVVLAVFSCTAFAPSSHRSLESCCWLPVRLEFILSPAFPLPSIWGCLFLNFFHPHFEGYVQLEGPSSSQHVHIKGSVFFWRTCPNCTSVVSLVLILCLNLAIVPRTHWQFLSVALVPFRPLHSHQCF